MSDAKSKTPGRPRNAKGDIREVARAAGLSIATVSRAFNRPESVRPRTREHVYEAAKQLGYIANSAARALGSQMSRRIGVLIPTIDDSIFACFIGALQQRLGRDGYTLLLGVYDFDDDYEAKELRSLLESGVDGVIFCGARRRNDLYELLKRRNVSFIIANIFVPDSPLQSVGPDFRSAAAKTMRYLLDLGHRMIGYVDLSTETNDRAALRLAGVLDALRELALDLPSERYLERPLSIEDGRIALRTLLEQTPGLTAINCGNDILAVGALFEARDMGISVPDELSIVGFDNLELSAQISPTLTTTNIPSAEMGERVAENLLLTLMGKPTPHATRLKTNLIVRNSTGPVPSEETIRRRLSRYQDQ